jgi:hypothetical protein
LSGTEVDLSSKAAKFIGFFRRKGRSKEEIAHFWSTAGHQLDLPGGSCEVLVVRCSSIALLAIHWDAWHMTSRVPEKVNFLPEFSSLVMVIDEIQAQSLLSFSA